MGRNPTTVRRGRRWPARALAGLLLLSLFAHGVVVSVLVDQRSDLTAALTDLQHARADADDAVEEGERLAEQLADAEAAAEKAQEAVDAAAEEAVAAEETATAGEAEARAKAERKAEQAREAAERVAAQVVAAGGSCDKGTGGLPVCEYEPQDDGPTDDTAGLTPVWDRQGDIEWLSDADIDELRDAFVISCEPASYEDEEAGLECWYLD